jgi:uncharacterized protein YcfJ
MKITALTVAVALAFGATAAFAGPTFEDYARVRDVTPQYDQVNVPRKECYSEYVPERSDRGGSLAGPVIGGVAGGLLGSRFGQGNGRVASAAAGAVVGTIVGTQLGNRDRGGGYEEREVRRCRTVDHFESRLAGYRVAYEYQGRSYTTFLPYDPGSRIPVRVSVEAVAGAHGDYDRDR